MYDFTKTKPDAEAFGLSFTTSEIQGLMVSLMNPKSAAAAIFGTFRNAFDQGYKYQEIMSEVTRLIGLLTSEERAAALLIVADHDAEVDRVEKALIMATGKGFQREENYVGMHRIDPNIRQGKTITEDMANAIITGDFQAAAKLDLGFTIKRLDISNERQTPINLDIWSNWWTDITRQEHAAAYSGFVRDIAGILSAKDYEDDRQTVAGMIRDRFGKDGYATLINNLNAMISPESAIAQGDFDDFADYMGRAASVTYLAYNLGPSMLQVLGVPRFLPQAGPTRLMRTMVRFMADPAIALGKFMKILPEEMKTRTRIAMDMDPQLADRKGDAAIREFNRGRVREPGLSGGARAAYDKVIDTGFLAMETMDRWAAALGYTATYEHCLYDLKMSTEGAHRRAQAAVLMTQQATNIKDTSRIWRSSKYVRVINMLFMSEGAKLWNMTQYDFVQGLSARGWNEKKQGFLTLFALAMTAALTETIKHGLSPDDDEYGEEPTAATYGMKYFVRPFMEQTISALPLVGKEAIALYDILANGAKWRGQEGMIFAPGKRVVQGGKYFLSGEAKEDLGYGDLESIWKNTGYLLEGISLLSPVPIPVTGIKRGVQSWGMKEDDPLKAALNMLGVRPRE
jgi:hypothetical protein